MTTVYLMYEQNAPAFLCSIGGHALPSCIPEDYSVLGEENGRRTSCNGRLRSRHQQTATLALTSLGMGELGRRQTKQHRQSGFKGAQAVILNPDGEVVVVKNSWE